MLDRWNHRPLGDIVKLTSGKTKPAVVSEVPSLEANYPVFGGNGILGWSSETNADGENIIIGRVGALCGCVHYYSGPCWITDNALYSKEFLIDVDKRYFAYLLEAINLARFRSASGQPLVSQGPIHAHVAFVPELKSEQRKIAHTLDVWDTAIRKYSELIASKRLHIEGLSRQFFEPCHSTADSRPGNWNRVELGDVFAERDESGRDDDRLLSITMSGGVIDRADVGRKDVSNDDKSSYKLILPGDIGYNTMRMWQGVSGLSTLRGIVSPAYTIVTPDNQNIDARYAAHLFKSRRMVFDFERYSQGLTSDTWNLKYPAFSKIVVLLPPISVQKKEAAVMDACLAEVAAFERLRDAIVRQKRGLMQKLLTGEWRVKPEGNDG